MSVKNHLYIEECPYSDHQWYEGNLSPQDNWYELISDFQFSLIHLRNIEVVKTKEDIKKKRSNNSFQLILNQSEKSSIQAIKAYEEAIAMIPMLKDYLASESTSVEFMTEYGKYMEYIGILRNRLGIQSRNRAGAGESSAKNTKLEAQKYWIALWLKNKVGLQSNSLIMQELDSLAKYVYGVCVKTYVMPEGFQYSWFSSMLLHVDAKPKPKFNTTFARIRQKSAQKILLSKIQKNIPPIEFIASNLQTP